MKGKVARLAGLTALCLIAGIGLLLGLASLYSSKPDQPGNTATEALADSEPDAGPSRVDYQRLGERIAKLMQDPDMVGLAVGTVEGGKVRFLQGFGETLAGSGTPITPDTVFRWASVSKGVAASLMAKLDEERRLSLSAQLSSMGTSLALPGDSRAVTVADVLSHRVGLVHNAWDERLEAGEDPKALRAMLGTLPQFCPPGTCYAYQNIAFDAASEMIERVTGEDFAAVARSRLFAPLGMTSTSIGRAGLQSAASWARPHRRGKRTVTVNDSYYRVPAAGGVNSSIRDLTSWMRAQMGDAPGVLSPAVLETLHRPRIDTPPRGRGKMDRALRNAAYGLGWRSFTYAGHALVGHRGSVDGYASLILFDPADKSGIVMLWNSNRNVPARLQLEFFDMLYGLPFTDWMEIDTPPAAPAGPEGNEAAIAPNTRRGG